jgi:hypothetical protein
MKYINEDLVTSTCYNHLDKLINKGVEDVIIFKETEVIEYMLEYIVIYNGLIDGFCVESDKENQYFYEETTVEARRRRRSYLGRNR